MEKNPQHIIYEGVVIVKFECVNHLQKRAHNTLLKYGMQYDGESNVPSGKPKKKPLDPHTPLVADFFAKLPKGVAHPTTELWPSDSEEPSEASTSAQPTS